MNLREIVTIGSELKEVFDREGMTEYRLAMELGLTMAYLSRLFKSMVNPSYGLIKRIAGILHCDLCLI